MNTAVEDPALADKKPQPFEPAPAAAAVAAAPAVAAPAVAAPAVAPAQQPSPEAASNLFSHFADGPAAAPAPASESAAPAVAAVAPKKVKTQAIHSDAGPMNAAIAAASGLSKAELPTAASTANNIINESGAAGVTNLNQVAYEMATARRESHMGNWMNEFGGNNYFEQHYGYKTKKGAELGNTHPHDGANFHGRGLVQTTGRTNYTKWTDRLAKEGMQHDGQPIDLVGHPELAADPQIAARMAVEGMRDGGFTKYKLSDFVNDKQTDYLHARKVINGMDAAQEIATQATRYQGVLEQNSGAFTDAIIGAQTKNLPSAHDGGHLTAPTPTDQMLDPARMGSGASHFERPDKLLKGNLGRFAPAEAPEKLTTLKTHPVKSEP